MKVIILGGTGFVGYHTCLELLKNGHSVSSVSSRKIESNGWLPKEIKMHFENIFELSSTEMITLFKGYDALIYSVGPDDRYKPSPPAYDFFYEKLVEIPTKIFDCAREAGIKKAVLAGSYFAYFARTRPELNLSKHAYINCRCQQSEAVIKTGKDMMDVMVLELPYIFGRVPERVSQWKEAIIKMLHESKTIYYPKGGTVMVTVQQVAKAFLGALENGKHGKCYLIGDTNMDWNEMIGIMLDEMNMEHKKIINLSKFILPFIGWGMRKNEARKGIESGLNPRYMNDFMSEYFYFDASETQQELGYGKGDIEKAIRDAVKASLPI